MGLKPATESVRVQATRKGLWAKVAFNGLLVNRLVGFYQIKKPLGQQEWVHWGQDMRVGLVSKVGGGGEEREVRTMVLLFSPCVVWKVSTLRASQLSLLLPHSWQHCPYLQVTVAPC